MVAQKYEDLAVIAYACNDEEMAAHFNAVAEKKEKSEKIVWHKPDIHALNEFQQLEVRL